MIITIDGPSASGKSSLAIALSRKIGFVCINSGAAYRVITKIVIDNNLHESSNDDLVNFFTTALEKIVISWITDDFGMKILCNGKDVTDELFSPQIDLYVSKVACLHIVRESVNKTLKAILDKDKNVCFEGRDMGVVFQNADIKVFLTASVESRAKRRYDQLKNTSKISYEEILDQMTKRDEIDSNRKINPLKAPEGAFVFDNSNYSLEETVLILEERVKLFEKIL